MPNLKPIKNIVERMKNMSHNLIVSANQFGKLTLKIETNMVTLSAHFHDLSVESFAGNRKNIFLNFFLLLPQNLIYFIILYFGMVLM